MGLETSTYVDGLNTANPAATDGLAQADDHIRLIKTVLKNTFPNLTGAVTATQANLNNTTAIPSTLTDLGISDGSNGMVLSTDGSGNFSFIALPAGTTDTNYYVNGGSFSGNTLTLTRSGLGNISISGFPQAITNNNQLTNGAGYITSSSIPSNVSSFTNDAGYITSATPPTTAGAVGTYMLARWYGTGKTFGTTVAGSTLRPAAGYGGTEQSSTNTPWNGDFWNSSSGNQSGTWRHMGYAGISNSSNTYRYGLFVKISA
jgi:hypothetical protein